MVDIWFLGQACIKVKGKAATLVFDPYDSNFIGLKPLKTEADIVCITHGHGDHNYVEGVKSADGKPPFIISGPGEYEISGVNVVGVGSFHDDEGGAKRGKNTIYQATVDEVNLVHLGDLGQKKLTQAQIEELSGCDILFIPVGGVYTIEAKDAPDIIAQLEPRIVVPIHYKLPGLKVDLAEVTEFLKVMGKENADPATKLSASKERLPEELEVAVLAQQ